MGSHAVALGNQFGQTVSTYEALEHGTTVGLQLGAQTGNQRVSRLTRLFDLKHRTTSFCLVMQLSKFCGHWFKLAVAFHARINATRLLIAAKPSK